MTFLLRYLLVFLVSFVIGVLIADHELRDDGDATTNP